MSPPRIDPKSFGSAGPSDRLVIQGATIPDARNSGPSYSFPPHGHRIEHPAVESLPEYAGTVIGLLPGCRAFNGSICRIGDQPVLAYRLEDWSGMNRIALAVLRPDWRAVENIELDLPGEGDGLDHWEDPRLTVVSGRPALTCAHVRFTVPTVCRQRWFWLDRRTLELDEEMPMPYGRNAVPGGVEKNWMPFELPDGRPGCVYSQRPHCVVELDDSLGHRTPGLSDWSLSVWLSGRTPPLRVTEDFYLAITGGHVKHAWRGGRYFVAAQIFEAQAPFAVVAALREPLAWGSEASPTYLSARPNSGHPICLYPAGAMLQEGSLIVSCGVNDSYTVILRYDVGKLIGAMIPVGPDGRWEGKG